jgi:hypothetical protein
VNLLQVYDFTAGPLFAFSCSVFALGSAWRVLRFLLLAKAADPAALKGFRPAWGRVRRAAPASSTRGRAYA